MVMIETLWVSKLCIFVSNQSLINDNIQETWGQNFEASYKAVSQEDSNYTITWLLYIGDLYSYTSWYS